MATSSVELLESAEEIDNIFSFISTLMKPPEVSDTITNILSSLENNLSKALNVCSLENIKSWIQEQDFFNDCFGTEETSWKFVCICLTSLLHLKHVMSKREKKLLLSVNQKTIIRSCLQFVSALGISPFLKPGIGISVDNRCRSTSQCKPELKIDISESEQFSRLASITRALVSLIEDKSWDLYGVVLASSLTDILPALVQLSWGPMVPESSKQESDDNKRNFQKLTSKLLQSTHQPTVIRELMVCLNPQSTKKHTPPPWYIRACSRLLTQRLLAPRGVISTVRALHDLGDSSAQQNKRFETTSKLLLGPHGPNSEEYFCHLCPQLVELLKSDNHEYQTVAVYTVHLLWSKDRDLCQRKVLEDLYRPFRIEFSDDLEGSLVLEKEHEEALTSSAQALLAITLPASLYVDVLAPCVENICNFHLATCHRGATPQLRAMTLELLSRIITHIECEEIWKLLLSMPEDCLINLASESSVANAIFINLLNFLHKSQDLDEKVRYCQLLMSVSEIPSVQKESLQKPNALLINTIKSFLEDSDTEMVPVALLLLGTMVSECENWTKYQVLVPALQQLRKSNDLNESLRAIAEEIISTIATYGAVGIDRPDSCKKKEALSHQGTRNSFLSSSKVMRESQLELISFQEAMQEIKDVEIPVQGHGYLALGKLVKKRDTRTLCARDDVFSVCMSGLEHEDSYVYLAAVAVLSALTLEFLDSLLPRVVEKYSKLDLGPTTRTRLGETLLQVCKGLGEMAGKHRSTLLGTFLSGTRDLSPAVRTSSLSNLGEACRVLGFLVCSQLQEILVCAHSLASSDPEMEVRRAAAMLVTLLLRGLGREAVPLLGASALQLYRGMKQLAISDDPTLALQAQLGLDELSHGIKEGMLQPQPMEKKIYISSPPP